MHSPGIAILPSDSSDIRSLVSLLSRSFRSVQLVKSLDELRASIAKHRFAVAILDMEAASLADVENLTRDFPQACVICTHRLADEQMWTAALAAGACDVCPLSDQKGILHAALGSPSLRRSAAA